MRGEKRGERRFEERHLKHLDTMASSDGRPGNLAASACSDTTHPLSSQLPQIATSGLRL